MFSLVCIAYIVGEVEGARGIEEEDGVCFFIGRENRVDESATRWLSVKAYRESLFALATPFSFSPTPYNGKHHSMM